MKLLALVLFLLNFFKLPSFPNVLAENSAWTAGAGFISTQSLTALICTNDDWVRSSDLSACHTVSLTEDWWVIYFLITSHSAPGTLFFIIFSLAVLSVKPSLFSLFSPFFLLYCPPFQHPVLSSLSYGRHDSLYQIELVRKIFLVWSQKPTVLLKDIVIGGVSRCMPNLEGGAILGQCCHTSFLYRLPPPTTFHWTPLSIQHNLTSLRHL